jgi:hypothetical protein
VFEAFIIRTSVCNEVIVWPGYIEESNKKSYLDKDNSDSLMFIEKCSNNVQEQEVNAKLEQSSTKMLFPVENLVRQNYPPIRRV